MNGNNRRSSVQVLKETVAPSYPDFFKANYLQGYDEGLS